MTKRSPDPEWRSSGGRPAAGGRRGARRWCARSAAAWPPPRPTSRCRRRIGGPWRSAPVAEDIAIARQRVREAERGPRRGSPPGAGSRRGRALRGRRHRDQRRGRPDRRRAGRAAAGQPGDRDPRRRRRDQSRGSCAGPVRRRVLQHVSRLHLRRDRPGDRGGRRPGAWDRDGDGRSGASRPPGCAPARRSTSTSSPTRPRGDSWCRRRRSVAPGTGPWSWWCRTTARSRRSSRRGHRRRTVSRWWPGSTPTIADHAPRLDPGRRPPGCRSSSGRGVAVTRDRPRRGAGDWASRCQVAVRHLRSGGGQTWLTMSAVAAA